MDYCAFHDKVHIKAHNASTYGNHKCRCRECRSDAVRKHKAWCDRMRRNVPEHVHGSENGYTNYRCRCAPCTKANTEQRRTRDQVSG